MYPIHLIFCLVVVAKKSLQLIEAALQSERIDSNIRPTFVRAKNVIADENTNLTSMSLFIMIVVTLSKDEIKDLKTFLKQHDKDVEEGATDVIGALYVIHELLRRDEEETVDYGWCCLPTIAILPGKAFNDPSFILGGEYRVNWVLATIFAVALVCLVIVQAGGAIKDIISNAPPT